MMFNLCLIIVTNTLGNSVRTVINRDEQDDHAIVNPSASVDAITLFFKSLFVLPVPPFQQFRITLLRPGLCEINGATE